MLVLTRKCGEQICVPTCDLVVTVLGLSGNRVRLGFSAPDDVAILREEVWHRIKGEAEAEADVVDCLSTSGTPGMRHAVEVC